MAAPSTMKALASLLLLLTLIMLSTSEWSPVPAAQASAVTLRFGPLSRILLPIDCPGSCNVRCSLAGVAKRCIRYCMICCNQCQCVPPGTVGNKEVCPCYASLKNSKGTSKCP